MVDRRVDRFPGKKCTMSVTFEGKCWQVLLKHTVICIGAQALILRLPEHRKAPTPLRSQSAEKRELYSLKFPRGGGCPDTKMAKEHKG